MRSLTAAAQRVTDPQKQLKKTSLATVGDDWQDQAWKYLELVGELAYYASWRSSSASRVRFVASEIDDNGAPTGTISDDNPEGQRVRNIVNSIAGGAAGQSQLLKRHVYLLTIPGECWAAMIVRNPERETTVDGTQPASPADVLGAAATTEQWYVFNREEITTKGDDVILSLSDGKKHTFDPSTDVMFRVWDPHPKNAALPVSPVWANRTVLNEIVKATATIDNAAKSRLVGNGLMFIPQEMSLPNQVAPTAAPAGSEPPPPGLADQVWEPSTSQELQDLLYDVASTAIKDPDSLAALLPIIASGPGEWIKNIQWLRPASDIPETALKTRTEAIRRLAMGLDVAPERLLGLGNNSNHWSAWAIDEADVRIHIAPPVETVCHAFTQEVLRPKLIQEGIDPDRYVVWHDDTRLTQDPDKKDEARDAHDRGALSSPALLKHLGFGDGDGYDLTSKEGWMQLAMDKAAKDPNLIPLLAPLIGELVAGVETPDTTPPQIEPTTEPVVPEQEPPNEPTTDDGLNAAAYGFTRLCVNRALEMANKRQRTRTNVSAFQGVAISEAHLRLPPVAVGDAATLVRGWDTCVDDQTCAAFGFDIEPFRHMVNDTATRSLTSGQPWRFDTTLMTAAKR